MDGWNGSSMDAKTQAQRLRQDWEGEERWQGVRREYAAEDVMRLRGSVLVEHTLARLGAARLWHLMRTEPYVAALGALTGNQAVQMVKAGLKAIYLSGWQTAADNNHADQMYPDQSLYPWDSVPSVLRKINNALLRADQIEWAEGKHDRTWLVPIVADAEAGFGGPLNAFEVMKAMIESGASGVHFEDQLASAKKCGHMGGKVLIPMSDHVHTLTAARLAADITGVATVLVARTDAHSAKLLTSDNDPRDHPFLTGKRDAKGFFYVKDGMEHAIQRSLAYAPHADLLWYETSKPDLDEARLFADAIHLRFPGKMLAYNLSPSFNWRKHLDEAGIARFQRDLAGLGYKFQFVTLAGFHTLNTSMFDLAKGFAAQGMSAYVKLQEREFALEREGYTATKHQREVGTGYFDSVAQVVLGEDAETLALKGSTEEAQFEREAVLRERVKESEGKS